VRRAGGDAQQPGEEVPDVDRKAPTRFSDADSVTATFGLRAPLAIDVAIALPVSWKPLVKSKARAVITTMIRVKS
jgi:hypothetical protein